MNRIVQSCARMERMLLMPWYLRASVVPMPMVCGSQQRCPGVKRRHVIRGVVPFFKDRAFLQEDTLSLYLGRIGKTYMVDLR